MHLHLRSVSSSSSLPDQRSIVEAYAKAIPRVSTWGLLHATTADKKFLITGAKRIQEQFPIRFAHLIKQFQHLPHIVATNQNLLRIIEDLCHSFQTFQSIPNVLTDEDLTKFHSTLNKMLVDYKDFTLHIARGFKETQMHMDPNERQLFLDTILCDWLSVRLIALHWLNLEEVMTKYIGIFHKKLSIRKTILRCASFSKDACELNYGRAPEVVISGHTDLALPYVPYVLEYILKELLKNSMKAVAEFHSNESSLPPVDVVISSDMVEFCIKISDQGGGVPRNTVPTLFRYGYTSDSPTLSHPHEDIAYGRLLSPETAVSSGTQSPLHGFGYGLPVSAAYAKHFGGRLLLVSQHQWGMDAFLSLKHLDDDKATVYL